MSECEPWEYKTKYYGWYYFCPVYVYDPELEYEMGWDYRHWSLQPVMWLAEVIGQIWMSTVSLFGIEPNWMIFVGDIIEDKRTPEEKELNDNQS